MSTDCSEANWLFEAMSSSEQPYLDTGRDSNTDYPVFNFAEELRHAERKRQQQRIKSWLFVGIALTFLWWCS
jgi:hypothetical protein